MAKYSIEGNTLNNLASVTQTLSGTSELLTPNQIANKIQEKINNDKAFYEADADVKFINPYIERIGYRMFNNAEHLTEIDCKNVKTIAAQGLRFCSNLNTVNFPKLETLADGGFYGPNRLTNIEFESLVTIGNSAFRDMEDLRSVSLPKVESLGIYAFRNCAGINSFEFPSLKSINSYAFQDCLCLTEIILSGSTIVSLIGAGKLFDTAGNVPDMFNSIFVPDDLVNEYKVATNWTIYADYIKPLSAMEV